MEVDYSPSAVDARLRRAGELHRLGVSLRDARASPGVELPVFATIVRALARFRAVEDITGTCAWTAAVTWALVDVREPLARVAGVSAAELDLLCSPLDFMWVRRGRPEAPILVAESEWGDWGAASSNDDQVMTDFVKMMASTAPYRLLVYGYHDATVAGLEQKLAGTASRGEGRCFLFVGMPWLDARVERMRAWRLRSAGGAFVREGLAVPRSA
jgi:hypothetical protein